MPWAIKRRTKPFKIWGIDTFKSGERSGQPAVFHTREEAAAYIQRAARAIGGDNTHCSYVMLLIETANMVEGRDVIVHYGSHEYRIRPTKLEPQG